MSIPRLIGHVEFLVGREISEEREVIRGLRGGAHIISRMEELRTSAFAQGVTADQVQATLIQAAEYALAAQDLAERHANPAENDAEAQRLHEESDQAAQRAEALLQEIIQRYQEVAHLSVRDLSQIEQAITNLQAQGLLARQPPTTLERAVFNQTQYYPVRSLTPDMIRVLFREGGQIIELPGGQYAMSAVLDQAELMERSAMMAAVLHPESTE